MKACFIQKQLFPYFGIMAISGVLKQQGYQTDVLIQSCEKDIIAKLKTVKPDLIGFSVLSTEHTWLKNLTKLIKQNMPGVPIIVGGVHAVLYPEEILQINGVDYVCYGEGEIPLQLLLERIENDEGSPEGIVGIGYWKDGVPTLQGVAPLIQNLDSFKEDRDVYYNRYAQLRDLSLKVFSSSRGCPFKCSFCANTFIMQTYTGRGRYMRRKSPSSFVKELKQTVDTYGATTLFLVDDLFALDIRWLEDFSVLYKSEVGLPYICSGRAGVIEEKHAKVLANSGCHTVSFGVETGNETLRQNILKKTVSNKDLFECANILKRAGIQLQTSNMFCLPGETVSDAISTIDLNAQIGTNFMFTTIFLPFPKTELAEYCIQRNILAKDYSFENMPHSFIEESVLNKEDKRIITNIHKIAHLCIRFPKLKPFFIYLAKRITCNKLFFILWLMGTIIRFKEERKLAFFQTIQYLWSYRKGL